MTLDSDSSGFPAKQTLSKLPWKFLRRAIQVRDGFKCRKCKAKRRLTVHHIRPRDEGGSDEPRNLITLCSPCHDWAEIQTSEGHLGWVDLLKPPEGEAIKRVWWQDSQGRINALVFEEDENLSEIEIAKLIKPPKPLIPIRPSETTTFIRCPKLWHYKHVEGWTPPDATWEPWQLMGSAVHAGLQGYWAMRQAQRRGETVRLDLSHLVKLTFDLQWLPTAPPEFSREGLEAQSLKVLSKTLDWIGTHMADAEPVLVEHTLREDGCTPDLVTREQGQLVVTDWKTSWNLDASQVARRLEGIERTHQFLDYAWAVEQHLKEPVALVRKVVIVGSPRILVREGTFRPTPPMLAQWLAGARQMWHDMHEMRAGRMTPYQREAGCMMYGPRYPCPMFDACWTCHGDREKMGQFYTREGDDERAR